MGLTKVSASICDLARTGPPFEADFLVDTGAIDCLAPSDKLRAAGIKAEGKAVYELANGKPVKCRYGFARICFMGVETVSQVVFGPPKSEPLLGVTALENAGFAVDPVSRTLRRLRAKPLK